MTAIKLQVGEDGVPFFLINGKPSPIKGSLQLSAVSLAESLADAMRDGVLLEKQAAPARPGRPVRSPADKLVAAVGELDKLADRLARLEREPGAGPP